MNTPYKHREILSDNIFVYENDDIYLVWSNEYTDDELCTVSMTVDIFTREGDMYRRSCEEIQEIAPDEGTVRGFLEKQGFEILSTRDDYTEEAVHEDTERIVYIARKTGDI